MARITVTEAAGILKVTRTRVLQLVHAKTLRAEMIGWQYAILKNDVIKYMRRRKTGRPRKQ